MLDKIKINPKAQKLIVYIFLIMVTLAVYWQVNHFNFINFDDRVYILDNPNIKSGLTLDGFRWAFSTRYLDLWNPLLWLSFMFDYQIHGMNPGGYHLTNLILHILSTLLLFWLFCRMTGAVWKSAFVAALFALHPLHVESVAWIPERKDVLSALFWMLTLFFYVRYTEKPVISKYLLAVFAFILALMSKPMVVTLPLILILLDYWPLNRFESLKNNMILRQLKEKAPFFILSTVFVIITLYTPDNIDTSAKGIPLDFRLANATVSFMTYIEKTFWPSNLAAFYPFPDRFSIWQVSGSAILIIAISIAVILLVKRLPYLFVGWFWYTIAILPVIGIKQISLTVEYAMADRYHYLPSIGIFTGIAWGIPYLIRNDNLRRRVVLPAGVIVVIILSCLTWRQCGYWKNSTDLFKHSLQATKASYLVHTNLASALSNEGMIEEAIYHYNEAIRINSGHADIYYNRGNAYIRSGRYRQAIEDYNTSIALNPLSAEVYNNRGIAYIKLDLYKKAKNDFDESIRLKPDYTDAYTNRASVFLNQGDKFHGCNDAKTACALGDCITFNNNCR